MKDAEPRREKGRDDIELALPALKRAAEVARERAKRHGGGVIVWRDGRPVEEPAPELPSEERRAWDIAFTRSKL